MPRSIWSIWKSLLLIVVSIYLLVLVLLPLVVSLMVRISGTHSAWKTRFVLAADEVHSYLMIVFAAAWVFFLGGVFASFLNVVASRIPKGKSILGSSHCPYCNANLSFKDNIPIWGWIKNEGRCSTCRLPIARRYLIVEITLGTIFLLVVSMELVTGGITLPIRPPDPIKSPIRMLFEPSNDLVMIVGYHLVLVLTLFVFLLIEVEKKPIPVSVLLTAALAAIAYPLILPPAVLVGWDFPFVITVLPVARFDVLVGLIAGAIVGCLAGYVLEKMWHRMSNDDDRFHIGYGMTIVGIILGWQSAIMIGLFFGLLNSIPTGVSTNNEDPDSNRRSSILVPHANLLLAALLHLASWRWFNVLT